jgi:hypothetical protein
MVGQAYGRGITKELAEKLGVLDSAEGMESQGPDTPMQRARCYESLQRQHLPRPQRGLQISVDTSGSLVLQC